MRSARQLTEHGGCYHVILKATGPQFLFREDADKQAFQDILERSAIFSGVGILAFALLDNHFHILVRVPDKAPVPEDEFRRRVEALYGRRRAERMFDRWERLEEKGRGADAARERDGLARRMHDLGQFVKTLKEWHSRHYREAHGWEGTVWRGRYKSVIVGESRKSFRDTALYIAMNPVRAGIVARGAESRWSSYGQSKTAAGAFGRRCHESLLRELARLAGRQDATGAMAEDFDEQMADSERVSRDEVRAKIARNESLSLAEMLVCRVRAFSNGLAVGELKDIESVPMRGRRARPTEFGCGLYNATRLRGPVFEVA